MVHKGGCLHGRKGERPKGGCKVGRKNEKTGRRRRRLEIVYDDEPSAPTDGETHVMPNGDVHTGATHTSSSRLVSTGTEALIQPARFAHLLGMHTDQEINTMSMPTNPFPQSYQGAPMYESEEESEGEEVIASRLTIDGRKYVLDQPPGKAGVVYDLQEGETTYHKGYHTFYNPEKKTVVPDSVGERVGILATDAQGNQYIERDDERTFPSQDDFYPVDEGDLQTIGERETGFSRAQLNALDPAELFGMLVPELKKQILTPDETGVQVGLHRETTVEQVGHLKKILKRQQKMAVNGQNVELRDRLDPSEIYTPRVYHMEGDRFTTDERDGNNPVVILQEAIDDLDDYLDYGTLKGGKYSKYVSIKTEIPVVKVPTLKELGMTRFVMYTRPLKEAISEFLDQLNDVNAAARKRLG